MVFWRKKEEPEKEEEPKEELKQLIEKVSPDGWKKAVEQCKKKEWEATYRLMLRALSKRLLGEEEFWLGGCSKSEVKEILNAAIETYVQHTTNKLILPLGPGEEMSFIYLHPLLGEWAVGYDVRLEDTEGRGVPVVLQPYVDEEPKSDELYIRVHRDIVEISLAVPGEGLKEDGGVRANYKLTQVKRKPILNAKDVRLKQH